ncbi:MAG: hypothetical protein V4591_09390 [Bdellovibrionota bacterium]
MQSLVRIHNVDSIPFTVLYSGVGVGVVLLCIGAFLLYLGRK